MVKKPAANHLQIKNPPYGRRRTGGPHPTSFYHEPSLDSTSPEMLMGVCVRVGSDWKEVRRDWRAAREGTSSTPRCEKQRARAFIRCRRILDRISRYELDGAQNFLASMEALSRSRTSNMRRIKD